MALKIGADPEIFVKKNGKFVSGHVFPCGTKHQPRQTKHGTVQVDGMALEFNVKPAANKKAFVQNVQNVYTDLSQIVHTHDKEASLEAVPTVHFDKTYLDTLPREALELGCNPDFNAYERQANPKPDPTVTFRTGAGHVHLGWCDIKDPYIVEHFRSCARVVKELDFFLGLASFDWDTDGERRQLYGKAGAFRPKLYGVEYRVLSNAWIRSPDLVGRVYALTTKAFASSGGHESFCDKYGTFARDMIDNNIRDWQKIRPDIHKELSDAF